MYWMLLANHFILFLTTDARPNTSSSWESQGGGPNLVGALELSKGVPKCP